ncbi:hypothetical protein BDB01DRAFT_809448 [Pilobolus umbonatus]|nr:hypothetical protein BDB01DRAFT_809448 [Pilobolus umbonatus]
MSASIHAPPTTYASRAAANVPPHLRRSTTSGVPRNKDAIACRFTYLYMPCRLRRRYSETRKALSRLGLPSSRVLDVCYPVNGMVGILVHNDYVEEATMTLSENGISLFGDCDPNDPILLKDPKFDSDPEEVRKQTAIMIHQNRLLKVLQRLRSPIRLAVDRPTMILFFASSSVTESNSSSNPKRDTDAQMNDIAANFIQAVSPYSDQAMDQAEK